MLTPNRILLVSDFSASAEAALCYAAALARQSQASLLVMHVIETGAAAFSRWTDVFRSSEVLAAREAADLAAMERLLAHPALADLSVDKFVAYGNPVDHITDMAPRVDLVVMGTGGDEAPPGQAHGTVARQVAHASATPILLVPPGGGAAGLPTEHAAHVPFRQLLLAIDLAQYAPQAVEAATAVAADCQAPLLALQIIEPGKASHYPVDAGRGLHHNVDGLTTLLVKHLAEVVPDEAAEGPPRQRVVQDGPAVEAILHRIAEHRADLVVMSVHAYGALRKFFMLSTVDAVLAQAPCPLLAVPFARSAFG